MAAVDRIWECEWSYVWGFEEGFGSTFRLYLKVRYWTPVLKSPLGFLGGLNGKESACNVREPDSIPGRYPGEGNGYSLQYSCLENCMDRGAWWATPQGVTKSGTRLSDLQVHFHWVHHLTGLQCFTSHLTHLRRQWHPTPVLLSGKSHGRRSLVSCSLWGC